MSGKRMGTVLFASFVLLGAAGLAGAQQQAELKQRDEKQAVQSERKTRVKLGTITVGGFFAHHSGYPYYPYLRYPHYYSGYGPFFWDPLGWPYYAPFYHPAYFTGFARAEDKGEVRLSAEPKTAEIYLDGGYAGTADSLKTMWLDPGAYELTVSAKDRQPFHRRIYVLTGKTLRISAPLLPGPPEAKP